MSEPKRKLATIVFTDIVGFTKLSAENEPLALNLLKIQRTTLKPIVKKYNGSWKKEIGDGLLLVFSTIKEAVDCSIEIQHSIKHVASLDLRIGIHQGEIIVDGDDVIGDDVNITSRIEPFSAVGGIAISDRINSSLIRDPVYQTKLIGEPTLKGVRQEVKIYSVISHGLPDADVLGGAESIDIEEKRFSAKDNKNKGVNSVPRNKVKGIIIGAVILLLVAGIFFLIMDSNFHSNSNNSEKESIAVLPFINMSADKDNEFFSDGITEEILNYLAKVKHLRVISRTSVFTYKNRSDISVSEIGKELGVSHVLEGSVRKSDNKVRITSQLIRTRDDSHLWSETFDRDLKDIFKVQDEIAQSIVNKLKMDFIGHSDSPIKEKNEIPLDAFNAFIQGRQQWNKRNKEGLENAIQLFKRTLSIYPEYDLAYAGIATSYGLLADYNYMSHDDALALAHLNSKKALEINPNSAEVNTAVAFVNWIDNKNINTVESYFDKAIILNPNYVTAAHWYSNFLALVKRDFKKSISLAEKAYRLDPASQIVISNLSNSYGYVGRLIDAEKILRMSIEDSPDFYRNFDNLSLVLQRQGRFEEAENLISKYLKKHPKEFAGWWALSLTQIRRGNFQSGLETIKKASDLSDENNPVRYEFEAFIDYFSQNFSSAKKKSLKAINIVSDVPIGNLILGCVLAHEGDMNRASTHFENAYSRFKGLWIDYEYMSLGYLGAGYAINDDYRSANSIIKRLEESGDAPEKNNFIGMIYLLIGETEKGWSLLEKNMEKYGCYIFLRCDPYMKKFHNDKNYISLLKKYNL